MIEEWDLYRPAVIADVAILLTQSLVEYFLFQDSG